MPGTMSQQDLVDDLKASMRDIDQVFKAAADADFIRHLNIAAADLPRVKPRRLQGAVTLVADQDSYVAPSDLVRLGSPLWGNAEKRCRKPWDSNWPGELPCASVVEVDGVRSISLRPPPTAAQIADLGAEYVFFYYAPHSIGVDASDTTVLSFDRGLLLLRAQAEAMKEIAARNSRKPVTMRDGLTGSPKNGTPAALFDQLMKSFEAQAQ